MIIDIILDRKNGFQYDPQELYDYAMSEMYIGSYEKIAHAMDCLDEKDVKKALCDYIDNEQYNPAIKDYINSVNWIQENDMETMIAKFKDCENLVGKRTNFDTLEKDLDMRFNVRGYLQTENIEQISPDYQMTYIIDKDHCFDIYYLKMRGTDESDSSDIYITEIGNEIY